MRNLLFLTPILNGSGNYSTAKRLTSNLKSHFNQIHLINSNDFKSSAHLNEFLIDLKIDLIICIHAYHSGRLFYELDLKQPLITILGGTDVHSPLREWLPIIRDTMDKSKYLICFNEEIRDRLRDNYQVGMEKCVIIRQGVIVNPCKRHLNAIDVTNDLKIISWVGCIRKVKDPLFLQSILPKIKDFDPHIVFVLAGFSLDGQLAQQVKRVESEHTNFRWLNGLKTDEAHALIHQSWAFLNTSINEGMSLAILEAMMLKCTLMVRNNFGNRSIVHHELTGLLFDTQDDLLNCIIQLLNDEKLKSQLKENAYKYVIKHHSSENELKMYLNLLNE